MRWATKRPDNAVGDRASHVRPAGTAGAAYDAALQELAMSDEDMEAWFDDERVTRALIEQDLPVRAPDALVQRIGRRVGRPLPRR